MKRPSSSLVAPLSKGDEGKRLKVEKEEFKFDLAVLDEHISGLGEYADVPILPSVDDDLLVPENGVDYDAVLLNLETIPLREKEEGDTFFAPLSTTEERFQPCAREGIPPSATPTVPTHYSRPSINHNYVNGRLSSDRRKQSANGSSVTWKPGSASPPATSRTRSIMTNSSHTNSVVDDYLSSNVRQVTQREKEFSKAVHEQVRTLLLQLVCLCTGVFFCLSVFFTVVYWQVSKETETVTIADTSLFTRSFWTSPRCICELRKLAEQSGLSERMTAMIDSGQSADVDRLVRAAQEMSPTCRYEGCLNSMMPVLCKLNGCPDNELPDDLVIPDITGCDDPLVLIDKKVCKSMETSRGCPITCGTCPFVGDKTEDPLKCSAKNRDLLR